MKREGKWVLMASLLLAGCGAGGGAPPAAAQSASALTIDAIDEEGNLTAHLDVDGKRVLVDSRLTGAEGSQTRVLAIRAADGTSYAEREVDVQTHDARGSYVGQPFGHADDVAADADRELWSGIARSEAAQVTAAVSRAAEAVAEEHPEAGETLGELRAVSGTLDDLASRTAIAPEDPSIDPDVRGLAAKAVGAGPTGVREYLKRAESDRSGTMAAALVPYLRTTETMGLRNSPAISGGCRGKIWSRHHIDIFGVNVGWQEADLDYFCWNGRAITRWGNNYSKRWSAAPYCWKDTSNGDYFTSYPKWRRVWTHGTLGGNAVFGCISLQSDEPYVDYANGGGAWAH